MQTQSQASCFADYRTTCVRDRRHALCGMWNVATGVKTQGIVGVLWLSVVAYSRAGIPHLRPEAWSSWQAVFVGHRLEHELPRCGMACDSKLAEGCDSGPWSNDMYTASTAHRSFAELARLSRETNQRHIREKHGLRRTVLCAPRARQIRYAELIMRHVRF